MLSVELLVAEGDNRRAPRRRVRMPGRMTTSNSWRAVCRIVDISRYGVRLETLHALPVGQPLWITLPGERPRKGAVAWADGQQAGCVFDKPLDKALVDSLIARFSEPDTVN
ncbi:PilZ domain-containing protein [Sphingomonas sp.]|uniref:PilZ domain-containing protein n=1 Tax=Sphingomonas sp. TaxID=28214 RepID=UPI001D55B7DF|nr:PilZ domain-containing protein [Sphingomonas sp.]MBX9796040.1 PilZ domain-containing protein [Sphingomonas sp.]